MNKVKEITFLGCMLAVVMVLSVLENMLPPIPGLPPNVKLGLSNICVMYCVFFLGKPQAIILNALKSCFVFLIRGPMAGILSLCGGMLSISVMIVLITLFHKKISYTATSIAGATAHNMGQLAAVCFILGSGYAIYYFPVLLVSGIVMGIVTGMILRVILPAIEKIRGVR